MFVSLSQSTPNGNPIHAPIHRSTNPRRFGGGKYSDSASEQNSANFPTAESSPPPPNTRSATTKKKPTRFSSGDSQISAASTDSPEKPSREKQQHRKGYYGRGGDEKSSGFRGSAGRGGSAAHGGDAKIAGTPYASGSFDDNEDDSEESIFREFPSEEGDEGGADEFGDGEEWRYAVDEDKRGSASTRTDRRSVGGQGGGRGGLAARWTEELDEKPAALDSRRPGGAGEVEGRKRDLEGVKGKTRRRTGRRGAVGDDSGDEDELCPGMYTCVDYGITCMLPYITSFFFSSRFFCVFVFCVIL